MTRPGPRGRRRAPSCSITSRSSTTGSGGIRRSAISARGRSSGGANRKRWQLNPGVYQTGASPAGILASGCSMRVQERDLYGVYVAEYENGRETLTLEKGGKYLQEV